MRVAPLTVISVPLHDCMNSSSPAHAASAPSEKLGDAAHVVASIVSHGHGSLILELVQQLQARAEPCLRCVIVTLNINEPELARQLAQIAPASFELQLIHNASPKGFGSNHNSAFAHYFAQAGRSATHVCILNPDLQLVDTQPIAALVEALQAPSAGLAYPCLLGTDGQRQDNERELPSFSKLLLRRVFKRTEQQVDWVSGACMVLRAKDWQRLEGFNEQFHMYCEDVDLSLRVRRDIGSLVRANTTLLHGAQRASHRQWRHLFWHIQSLVMLWQLPSFRWARRNPSAARRAPL